LANPLHFLTKWTFTVNAVGINFNSDSVGLQIAEVSRAPRGANHMAPCFLAIFATAPPTVLVVPVIG
jgi:hypothetical protein